MHLLRDIRLKTVVLAATSLTVLSIATSLVAYPTPAAVPYRWELAFEPGPLRLFVDSASDSDVYWYFTYKITNRTGRDQVWAPSLTLFTDAGEIMNSGRDVPTRVVDAIDDLLGNELLETQNEINQWRNRSNHQSCNKRGCAASQNTSARLPHPWRCSGTWI